MGIGTSIEEMVVESRTHSRSIWVQEKTELGEVVDITDKPGCLSM